MRVSIDVSGSRPDDRLKELGLAHFYFNTAVENYLATDPDDRDLETMLEIAPMQATALPPGTFDSYYNEKLAEDLPLDIRRPPRMNADDEAIDDLMRLASLVESGVESSTATS